MTPIHRLFLVSILTLAGCSTIDHAALHVGIADIKITDASGAGGEALITLSVANEELFPKVVESEIHKIWIDGSFIGEATGSETYALPKLGVAERLLKVRLTDAGALDLLETAIKRGGGEFRIESRLTTKLGDEKPVLVCTSAGHFTTGG